MICKYCNAQLPDGAVFCGNCGHKVEPVSQSVFCSNCGAAMEAGEVFCSNCGAQMGNAAPDVIPAVPRKEKWAAGKIRLPKKALAAIAGVLALVIVVMLVLPMLGSGDPGIVYVKDGQVQHIVPGDKEAFTLTDEMTEDELEGKNLLNAARQNYYGRVKLSADGKKMFYPDKQKGNSYTLYYQNMANTKKDAVKIDSGLSAGYTINSEGDQVIYLKNDKLYQHDLKEKTKIDSDVSYFHTSEDVGSIIYVKNGFNGAAPAAEAPVPTEAPAAPAGEAEVEKVKTRNYTGEALYVKYGKDEPVELDERVYDWECTDDISTVYYIVEYDLYMAKKGQEPEKIATDVDEILAVSDEGCYYTVQEEELMEMVSLLEDDMQDEESAYIMEYLKDITVPNYIYELYYHNGKESVQIASQMLDRKAASYEENFLCYTALNCEELPTIKLSEALEYEGSIYDLSEKLMNENTVTMIAKGADTGVLELENIHRVYVADKAETLWVTADMNNDKQEAVLHEVKLSGVDVKSVKELDDDIYNGTILHDGKNYVYWKSVKDNEGELYYNGEEIADDVRTGLASMHADSGLLFFATDYSSKKGEYTLACWNGKKVMTVDEDIYHENNYVIFDDGSVAYLKDYSTSKCEGDLYLWNGKKSEKVDEDVAIILPVYRVK